MIFAQYLDNHLKDFDATCSEVRQNGYKSDGLRYSGSYQPKSIKIDLNLWMIQCSHIQISGVHISSCLFYRQLHFRSQPGSCLAILENGLKTELTLPAKTCLNDSSKSELSFGTKISMRNQLF